MSQICEATHLATTHSALTIRPATREDVPVILGFIRELAEYENLSHEVVADEAQLTQTLFGHESGGNSYAEVLLAIEDNMPVGFALFFHNYSTFLAKPGIYLEDLYVTPSARGKGYGKQLILEVAKLAAERNCGRVEWSVLDWNTPAIDFYTSLGAIAMDEWTVFRLTGESLKKVAAPSIVG